MDYASSLLGLLPGGRRTPGLKELLASVGTYLPAEQVARIQAQVGASLRMFGRDRPAFFFTFAFPIMFMVLFGLIFGAGIVGEQERIGRALDGNRRRHRRPTLGP